MRPFHNEYAKIGRTCLERSAAMKSSGLQGTNYRSKTEVKLKYKLKY